MVYFLRMNKKLTSLFLLPLLLTSCNKASGKEVQYEEAKNFIIENYTYNKANYLYQSSGKYKTTVTAASEDGCSGVFSGLKNTDGATLFPKAGNTDERVPRSVSLLVLNYEDLNDSRTLTDRVATTPQYVYVDGERVSRNTVYKIEDDKNMSISFEGTDTIEKIASLAFVENVTNNLGTALPDYSCSYEIQYNINAVGLFNEITLRLNVNQNNGDKLDVYYKTEFTWTKK